MPNLLEQTELLLARNRGRALRSIDDIDPGIRQNYTVGSGKVRDNILLPGNKILMIASDRISAFDSVMNEGVPGKGIVLTALTRFWLDKTRGIVPNHLLSAELADFPAPFNQMEILRGRAMLVEKLEMFEVECIVRGYLTGSGKKDYDKIGAICGIPLPSGLREADKLPRSLFTPSTKSPTGHDINISYEEMVPLVGEEYAPQLRDVSIELYDWAETHARGKGEGKGVIIADTKVEFGKRILANGKVIVVLADEVLTPDSSRFWPLEEYTPGVVQRSFDKQYLRDYLEQIGWNKEPPPPSVPAEVLQQTSRIYLEGLRRLIPA